MLENSFKPRRLQLLCFIGHFIKWDNGFPFSSFASDIGKISEELLLYSKLRALCLIRGFFVM